jgi:fermentation-respiration switch protein FrsA (DUF1100 family)
MLTVTLESLALLVIFAALVRLLEPRFAFLPMVGERVTPREFGIDFQPLTIGTDDGERLRGWSLARPAAPAKILYFHGNGGNLSLWAPVLAGIARRGYSVVAFDYRGYGLSTGRPTEQGLYRDVDAMVGQFWSGSPPETPIVYWGRSLGAAMAAYASGVRAPDGLILESGFPDVRSLVRPSRLLACLALFSAYRFPCADFVRRRNIPTRVLVMHGDDDHVVPIEQGRALFERIEEPKQFVVIRGGDHNDVTPSAPDTYWEAVDRFITTLPQPAA